MEELISQATGKKIGCLQHDCEECKSREWVLLSERKPPDGVPVLRWPGWSAPVSIDKWCDLYGCFLMSIEAGETATHWMPLPKAPITNVTGLAPRKDEK